VVQRVRRCRLWRLMFACSVPPCTLRVAVVFVRRCRLFKGASPEEEGVKFL
jgi:hypothetical protein